MLNNLAEKHKHLLQSMVIFPAWLLMICAGIFFLPALFLAQEKILSASILLTFLGLFILGFVTVKEKRWNYIGWGALTVALIYLMFSVPHGIQLIYLVIMTGIISIASYLGFAYSKSSVPHISIVIAGVLFLLVFVSHSVILSSPKTFGLDVEGDEFATFTTEAIQKMAKMDLVEFVKTDGGRKIAVQVYNTSLFVSEEELTNIVRENPTPIKEAQQSLLSTTVFTNNPYSYIISVYSHPLLKFLKEE